MIRPATHQDIPAVVGLIEEFFSHGALDDTGLTLDADTMEFFVQDTIDIDDRLGLVAEVDGEIIGAIAGGVQPWMLNANILTVVELWWFVHPKYRAANPRAAMGLLRSLLKWGKEKGATVKVISSTKREESPRVIQFYENIGSKLVDSNFIGRL